ncbi:hypothetical protein KQX54_017363 [Cotesia glomerata]|uniref:Uncharacterized protein n=1 Tax=Cotesia glomerata TaxID=32391 RepID=A0AAV7IGB5_COTGL|nr:hypothetical protein KQX54_017363 [Cotesia glomerata]
MSPCRRTKHEFEAPSLANKPEIYSVEISSDSANSIRYRDLDNSSALSWLYRTRWHGVDAKASFLHSSLTPSWGRTSTVMVPIFRRPHSKKASRPDCHPL